MDFKVSVVVPSFNEEGNIEAITKKLEAVFQEIQCRYEVIFVDDGSKDGTLTEVERVRLDNPSVHYISFSRNFGHQNALKAGLDAATGDCVVSLDADNQHPPELIAGMLHKWQEGYDVVYTKRVDDKKLSFFKRKSSGFFYKLMNSLSEIEIEEGTADFRLMDKAVVNVIRQLPEREPFMRGLVKWVGFRQYCLEYTPNPRLSGQTKYSFTKMLLFALDGITSFSVRPLRLAMLLGFLLSAIGFLYGVFAFASFFFTDWNASGWTSVIMGVLFIGGLQLVMLGIIGEYIGKLFMQAKQRPGYIVKKTSLGIRKDAPDAYTLETLDNDFI